MDEGVSLSVVSKSSGWHYFQPLEEGLVVSNLFPYISFRNGTNYLLGFMVREGETAVDCFQKLEKKYMLQENLIAGLLQGVFQLVGLSRRCCDDRNIILKTD